MWRHHCTQAQAEMTLLFRAAFIAPCSGGGHRWYIFHKPSLRRTEKVNIEPLLLPKKCVQVSSSSSGHANNLDVRGNRSFDVGNKATRGRTVYPLYVCGWFPERLMNFKWAGQRVKSHTDVENWVLSGQIFHNHIRQCERLRSRFVRAMVSEDQEQFVWFLYGQILDLNLSSLSSEPRFIIHLWKELSWPHPSCRAINISGNAMLNTQRSQGFLPMTQCSQGHSVARVLVSRVLRFKVLCSPD